MILPDELSAKIAVPALRAAVGRKLLADYDMKQSRVAEMLGVTQSAVSNYLRGKRGRAMELQDVEAQQIIDEIVRMLAGGRPRPQDVIARFAEACELLKRKRLLCNIHERLEPSLDINSCHVCDAPNE